MSGTDEKFVKQERAFLRASTAQIPVNEVRKLMHSYLKMTGENRKNMNMAHTGKTSDFDPTKHIIDYLPSPSELEDISDDDDHRPSTPNYADSFEKGTKYESPSRKKRFSIQEEEDFLPAGATGFGSDRNSTSSGVVDSINLDPKFESVFRPEDMRMLALVSHNNMKHSMKQFVLANKNVLKKFRVTGTNTTMTMLREVFGDDPDVVYGPSCKSGPLGGDAQLVAMAVTGELGGCIFFIDPMDSHPHSADIDCLVRQGNVHNILMMNNPCSAHVCMNTVRVALKTGHLEMIPSFFFDLESPSVEAYKLKQKAVLESNMRRKAAASIKMLRRSAAPRRRSVIEDFIEEEMREENISGEDQGASFQTAKEYSSVKNKAASMSQKNSKPKSMPNAQGEDVDCHCYFPTLRMRKFKM